MKTSNSSFRIPPKLKKLAADKAKEEERSLTSVVVQLLREWVK